MYEGRHQPVVARHIFLRRLARNGGFGALILMSSLCAGILGYHFIEGLSWIDSLLNASMILGGMGPIGEIHTFAGKLFASFYALFSGVVFLIAMGVFAAPIIHRFLHRFHLQ